MKVLKVLLGILTLCAVTCTGLLLLDDQKSHRYVHIYGDED
jgi:hypothetical protein